jgi:hypothetical protein
VRLLGEHLGDPGFGSAWGGDKRQKQQDTGGHGTHTHGPNPLKQFGQLLEMLSDWKNGGAARNP